MATGLWAAIYKLVAPTLNDKDTHPPRIDVDAVLLTRSSGTQAAALSEFVDDTKYTPATSSLTVIGAQADETATDSVDEGDAGALRMTLNRALYTTVVPGAATYFGSMQDDVSTFTPGTNFGLPIGGMVDDTATDTADEGDFVVARFTGRRAQAMNLDTDIRGENATTKRLDVSVPHSTTRMTTATTTNILSGAGRFRGLRIGLDFATGTITVYDSLTAAGTILYKYTAGAAAVAVPPCPCDIPVTTGITVITSQAFDVMVDYNANP